MSDTYLPWISGASALMGVLIGAAASIITMYIQSKTRDRRARLKQVADSAFEPYDPVRSRGMNKLVEFVTRNRARFIDKDDNVFAFSWTKVFRRWGFLEIVKGRYEAASAAFIANTKAVRDAMPPGTSPVSPELAAIQREGYPLSLRLHLEIESYYLFAKIVIDDVARAIEHYFGPGRGLSLDSHDDLAKDLRAYAAAKDLELSDDLIAAIADLKTRVCDYRDYQIAHEKSPRTMHATAWSSDGGGAHIVRTQLYPKETDKQSEAEDLDALRGTLEAYFDLVADMLAANETKANLKVATAAE